MLALEPIITARVREALAPLPGPWQVFGHSTDGGQRDQTPLASVMFSDARVADSASTAANVQAAWRVTLVARRHDDAASHLDAAFSAVMQSLHDWDPGAAAGRRWNRLRLEHVQPPQFGDDGLVGLDATFTTHARYDGQP